MYSFKIDKIRSSFMGIAGDLRPPRKYIQFSSKGTPFLHPYRNEFMRDRDNILYLYAFLRLSLKTQVVTFGKNDHTRNRMTHTLEVAQIARTMSRVLGLDEDLTEAIALGHDIGHTPFGHVGERTLNMLTNNCETASIGYNIPKNYRGFKHNLNGMRILVETKSKSFTNFTLFGIVNHSEMTWGENCKGWDGTDTCPTPTTSRRSCPNHGKTYVDFYDKYKKFYCVNGTDPAWSFEAYIVRWADEIAQRHHDIEDAIALNLININELFKRAEPIYMLYNSYETFWRENVPMNDDSNITHKWTMLNDSITEYTKQKLGKDIVIDRFVSFIVDSYVTYLTAIFTYLIKIFRNEYPFTTKTGIADSADFEEVYLQINPNHIKKIFLQFIERPWESGSVNYKAPACEAFEDMDVNLKKILMSVIINSGDVQRLDGKAGYIIRDIAKAYLTNPQQLPDNPIVEAFRATIASITSVQNENDALRLRKESLTKKAHLSKKESEEIEDIQHLIIKNDSKIDEFIEKTGLSTLDVSKIQSFEYRNALTAIRSDASFIPLLRVNVIRSVCNHIANMTDRYALEEHANLY